jgi:hypothetical protein
MALRHNCPFSGLWAASEMIWAMVDRVGDHDANAVYLSPELAALIGANIVEDAAA